MNLLRNQLSWLVLVGMISLPCSATLPSDEELRAIERAHAAVTEVEVDFRKALAETAAKGMLKKTLPGCRVKSPQPDKITVGRTSHRLRNPNNAAPPWTKPYLEQFSKAKRSEIPKYTLVPLGNRRYGYVEPIFVERTCLKCHGKSVDKDIREFLHDEYPKDQALEFNEGDFRGLLWLEMKQE